MQRRDNARRSEQGGSRARGDRAKEQRRDRARERRSADRRLARAQPYDPERDRYGWHAGEPGRGMPGSRGAEHAAEASPHADGHDSKPREHELDWSEEYQPRRGSRQGGYLQPQAGYYGQGGYLGGQSEHGPRAARRGFSRRKSPGYERSDERIREEVRDALTRERDLDAGAIQVKVDDGLVTLDGTVEHRRMKRIAEQLAESIAGVQNIANHLRVRRPGSPYDPARG